jgi:hypothetical protein
MCFLVFADSISRKRDLPPSFVSFESLAMPLDLRVAGEASVCVYLRVGARERVDCEMSWRREGKEGWKEGRSSHWLLGGAFGPVGSEDRRFEVEAGIVSDDLRFLLVVVVPFPAPVIFLQTCFFTLH